jgi:hypothetical protein
MSNLSLNVISGLAIGFNALQILRASIFSLGVFY